MKSIPIGVQLYSVRDDCAKDLPGVLRQIARMGYEGVEFAGYHGHSASDLRKMLDDNGLKCCGAHIPLEQLEGDALKQTMDFHRTIGNEFLICPWLPEARRPNRAGWANCAKLFNEISDKVRPAGFWVGYHNHHVEFTPLEGELPWDTFFGNTRPEVVMQFDTGNAMHGGGEAVPFLKKYPGRALTVHIKEFSKSNDKALIGEGDIPWKDVFAACESIGGTRWYIIEHETYAHPPLECVRLCLENVKRMLGR
jgi:sugar phosphate isomerase/epimerase